MLMVENQSQKGIYSRARKMLVMKMSNGQLCILFLITLIMMSEFPRETVILKQEATLVSLYHNTRHNYLVISPDVNNLESNPYNVETNVGEQLRYQYEVGIDFGDVIDGDELVTLLTNLYKKWEKKHKDLVNFVMPIGKTQYYVTIDITTAKRFDMGDLYVEYNIKLPEVIQCNNTLHGRTHVSVGTNIDGEHVWNFGHLQELHLEVETGLEAGPLKLYFEVISIDFWHRHRTEGYCFLLLPLTPKYKTKQLQCVRPEEVNGEERRFFVGGCNLIHDLEVLSSPGLQGGNYTYTSTGSLQVRVSTLCHHPSPRAASSPPPPPRDTRASALLLGAEAALRNYDRAKTRLRAATNID